MRRKSFLIVLVAVVASFAAGNAVGYLTYSSELAEIFDVIPEERAIAIAEGALTYWDERSEAYRIITGKVDSVELCVYHYPVCTPPGKTPPHLARIFCPLG